MFPGHQSLRFESNPLSGDSQVVCRRGSIDQVAKLNHAILGPEAIFITRFPGYECHVSAAFRSEQQHERICNDRWIAQRSKWYEGIVFSVDDQRRNAYVANQTLGAGFGVVVIRVGEAESWRDVVFVKLSDGADVTQPVRIVEFGKEFLFHPEAHLQSPQKLSMVDPVAAPHERITTRAQTNRW